jgi:virulence-associated protein VagC
VTEVEITVEGDARVIRPVKVDLSWESFFELRDRLRRENPESEFPDRDQPEPQERVWPD